MRYSFQKKDRSLPLFIDSIGHDWPQENTNRPTGYPYIHWLHTQNGKGRITIDNRVYELEENQGILIRANTPHRYEATTNEWQTAYFTFGGTLVDDILDKLNFDTYFIFNDIHLDIQPFIIKLSTLFKVDDPFVTLDSSEAVYAFLMLLKKHQLANQSEIINARSTIRPILHYIEEHYSQKITNETLADLIGYTPQYTSRLFKQVMQVSPYQYLLDLRIQKAKEEIANHPDATIEEIAYHVGFNDTSHFINLFKRVENVTPKQFQKFFK